MPDVDSSSAQLWKVFPPICQLFLCKNNFATALDRQPASPLQGRGGIPFLPLEPPASIGLLGRHEGIEVGGDHRVREECTR